jgi:hypothetical protein
MGQDGGMAFSRLTFHKLNAGEDLDNTLLFWHVNRWNDPNFFGHIRYNSIC